ARPHFGLSHLLNAGSNLYFAVFFAGKALAPAAHIAAAGIAYQRPHAIAVDAVGRDVRRGVPAPSAYCVNLPAQHWQLCHSCLTVAQPVRSSLAGLPVLVAAYAQ